MSEYGRKGEKRDGKEEENRGLDEAFVCRSFYIAVRSNMYGQGYGRCGSGGGKQRQHLVYS